MSDRKNIKVSEETFEKLRERKPSGVTWDYWFQTVVLGETDEATERMKELRENSNPES